MARRLRATTLWLPADVVAEARALGIDLSGVAEEAMIPAVRKAKANEWLRRNADAIEAYNERIKREGLFNDGLRLI
jgi:antitoxin CcdA